MMVPSRTVALRRMSMVSCQKINSVSLMMNARFAMANRFSVSQSSVRYFSTEGGEEGSKPEYIKEMKTMQDWTDALENRSRPVLIQAGASWCGPCNMLKP
jgi:thiol-disulfide isomerase/thioredoxin